MVFSTRDTTKGSSAVFCRVTELLASPTLYEVLRLPSRFDTNQLMTEGPDLKDLLVVVLRFNVNKEEVHPLSSLLANWVVDGEH